MQFDIPNSRTVACLLSVVMLLTTATPPVWTHCHQECSLGHDERCPDQQYAGEDDDMYCRDHAARCSVELKHRRDGTNLHYWTVGCNRNVSHYHVAWLGTTARVPVDKPSKQPNGESPHSALLHKAFGPLKDSRSSTCIESPIDLGASNAIDHVLPQLANRVDLPLRTLLCDVARRECTGVLVV